jgi:hypothetical protein
VGQVSNRARSSGVSLCSTVSKDRLIRAGLVTVTANGDGHPAYALTARGETTVHVLDALTRALRECRRADENDRKPGSPRAA